MHRRDKITFPNTIAPNELIKRIIPGIILETLVGELLKKDRILDKLPTSVNSLNTIIKIE